ncbi:MAG: hypothetical protein NZ918_02135 [Aigarchaeota archaeon]|nr:hypothetical protein [Aigarchaeota archaeon]MDW8021405.1 hypothetical protein [Nitrososphaerota archaeon]
MKEDENPSGELEVDGYIVSITPRTRKGLMEYKVKIMTLGGRSEIMYVHEPKIPLRPGIPVKVKAFLSKQSEKPRWIIESTEPLKDLREIEPMLVSIEEVTKGAFFIISGRNGRKLFSIPIKDEDVLGKIPEKLPQELYCIFIDQGYQITLVEVLRKKEYEIFVKTLSLIRELDQEKLESEKFVEEYLKNIKAPYLEAIT